MFGVVPKSMWNKLNPADENNLCSWAMRCLLIETDDRLILTDTGMGDKQDAKFFGHYYLHGEDTLDKSLAAHGFHREDITDVFLTHLHFDHCGGAILREGDRLAPAFRNAVYWSNPAHWDWAVHPNDREKASFLKENILPLQESGQLKFITMPQLPIMTNETVTGHKSVKANETGASEEAAIRDGITGLPAATFMEHITIRFVNGHTDAMMLPMLTYKNRQVVFMADLLPSIAHLPLPYVMAYDTRPLLTLQEKKSFLEEALHNNYILYFEHDPAHECCTLQMTEKGIRAGDIFRLQDI